MAIPPPQWLLNDDWVRDGLFRAVEHDISFMSLMNRKRMPTVESIKADVAKLRSVSPAGRTFIADRRMAIASVGPWRDTFVIPDKAGRYPAIIVRARRQGVSYSISAKQLSKTR